jgi:nucleoside-diphosphate-sugar epimerase
VARRLRSAGWQITVTGRDPGRMPGDLAAAGIRFMRVERDDRAALTAAVGDGCDLLVDYVCYTAVQARLLLPPMRNAGSTVMISSKAVYVDEAGNHVNSASPPRFPGPVTEQQPTMDPGDMPYDSPQGYGANKVAAELVLLDSGLPVTVLRPSKVHGEAAAPPGEWYFVKRALDHRPTLLLAGGGRGADHPSAAVNIAALVEVVAHRPGRRILNAADPDAPDGVTMSRVIAALTGHVWREVLLGDDAPPGLGRHPWHFLPPIVLDTGAAQALGYRPVGDYATTVTDEISWLVGQAAEYPAWTPPGIDQELAGRWFDYAAEDAWLLATQGG